MVGDFYNCIMNFEADAVGFAAIGLATRAHLKRHHLPHTQTYELVYDEMLP